MEEESEMVVPIAGIVLDVVDVVVAVDAEEAEVMISLLFAPALVWPPLLVLLPGPRPSSNPNELAVAGADAGGSGSGSGGRRRPIGPAECCSLGICLAQS